MKLGLALLQRLGLFAHKSAHADARYDQRLSRLGAREHCRKTQGGVFRSPDGRPAI